MKLRLIYIVITLALVTRFIGTNPSYNQFHSDEGITYSAATSMILNNDIDPLRYDYPALVPLINVYYYKTFFIPLEWVKFYLTHLPELLKKTIPWHLSAVDITKITHDYIMGPREINALFWGRYVTALFSFGNVLLLYFLTRRLFGERVGIIAALLLTFNFRAVTNAHIGLPDTYNAFFILLCFIIDTYIIDKKSKKWYLLGGLTVGLSFSIKYQIFTLLTFFWSHLLASWHKNKLNRKLFFNFWFLISILIIPLIFVLINPYFLIHFNEAIKSIHDVSLKYGMGAKTFSLYPYSYFFNIDYGPILSVFVIVGLILMTKEQWRKSILLLTVILPFFLTLTWYSRGGFYIRNFISITPLILIYAAYSINKFGDFVIVRLSHLKLASLVWTALLITILFGPVRNVLINDYYYTKPWDFDVLLQKDELILHDDAVVASHPFNPVSKQHHIKRLDFETATSYSFSEFKEQGGQYAYVNMDLASNQFYGWMTQGFPASLHYWDKPIDTLNNEFWGLSINEMMQYVVASAYKPWQAPESGLFLTKIPDLETGMNFTEIKKYNFDSNLQGWSIQDPQDALGTLYEYDDKQGSSSIGSIKANAGATLNGVARISSPIIKIQPGFSYRITGFIKSDQSIPMNKRNGFIRADFYPGVSGGVSSRYFGQDWQKFTFDVLAPKNANTMQVSFQIVDSSTYPFWLDDIAIEESSKPVGSLNSHAVPFDMYKDLLYPNSHGNL